LRPLYFITFSWYNEGCTNKIPCIAEEKSMKFPNTPPRRSLIVASIAITPITFAFFLFTRFAAMPSGAFWRLIPVWVMVGLPWLAIIVAGAAFTYLFCMISHWGMVTLFNVLFSSKWPVIQGPPLPMTGDRQYDSMVMAPKRREFAQQEAGSSIS
jgi:hypothetical protein